MPCINHENQKPVEEDINNIEAEEGPYKTCNFSRWSDTQFEDGTCSFSFLKLCKSEEEKAKGKEMERMNLLNCLKLEMKKESKNKDNEEVCENPFTVTNTEVAS
mmetsp:Transcript_7324/g.6480  ORF Transcript_7324/g.6480 Transcript_7324/m.6480 type:complete len:104 (-) Transcript_7324:6-317(-)